ncbi:MAG: class II SORL domain-containing protein [Desulfobacterales bacterium]|nr:class II SORL domain-containing protein [Desulfobacterales bacterium]
MSKKILAVFLFFLIFFTGTAFANKTSVNIEAPDSARKGTEITIKINVTHRGNNFIHYSNWVYVKANGEEIARWNFSMGNRPEDEKFSREVKYTVTGPTEIIAEGNCNIHGSNGQAVIKINVK